MLKFYCPACPAEPGAPCIVEGTGEIRPQLHMARVRKAETIIGGTLAQGQKPEAGMRNRPATTDVART